MVTSGFNKRAILAIATIVAVGLGIGWSSAAKAAPVPTIDPQARHFDHDRHNTEMTKGGHPAPACSACHQIDAKGGVDWKLKSGWGSPLNAGEHNRCFGSCHGNGGDHDYHPECSTLSGKGSPAKVCAVCHPVKARCRPSDMPASQSTFDSFAANFTHSKHLTLGTSIEKDCGYCHKAESTGLGKLTVSPHAMCGGCHNANGAKPAIADCQGCHTKPRPSTVTGGDPYRLRPFDHVTHANVSKQASCTGCHDKLVGATNESALPRPSMGNCQTKCHDGAKAFSAVGTKCTQCHKATTDKAPALRQDQTFNHAAHEKRNVNVGQCADCHQSDADGSLAAPGTKKDHMPCAKSGCHQTEFLAKQPKICGVCHDAAAPWMKNASRPSKIEGNEYYETMNHQSHIKTAGMGSVNSACASCHGDKLNAGAAPPRNHAACAKCHARGQAPTMNDCAACHSRNASAHAPVSQWSVAATFKHTQHANDPRKGRQTNCVECHSNVSSSTSLATVTAPKMSQCDGCHDGKTSFKSTGFGCARCHAAANDPAKQPTASLTLSNGSLASSEVLGE